MTPLAALAARLGAPWDGRAFVAARAGATVRLEPHGEAVELVAAHPGLPRDLWISASSVPHQGTVLRTHDPAFDAAILVVTSSPGAAGWFDASTRARIRRCFRGADRCSGLRIRLRRPRVDDALGALLDDLFALTTHLAGPPAPPRAALRDPVAGVRLQAAIATGDAPTLEALLGLPATARRAAVARAALPAPPPGLEGLLLDHLAARPDPAVVEALGRVGTARSIGPLRASRGPAAGVTAAVRAIRERVGGERGGVSLATDRGGELSEPADGGTLSEIGNRRPPPGSEGP